jgi:hypothetical protein
MGFFSKKNKHRGIIPQLYKQFTEQDFSLPSVAGKDYPLFVGIGVPKAGTTWWSSMLFSHPQIAPNRIDAKELHFFTHIGARPVTETEIRTYRDCFRVGDSCSAGEWTPSYFYTPGCLANLSRAVPEAKILFLVRDPVDRYFSHVQQIKNNRERFLSLDEVQSTTYFITSIVPEAFGQGLYSSGISEAKKRFGEVNVLVQQYEKCINEPEVQYKKLCEFLSLDDSVVGAMDFDKKINVTITDLQKNPEQQEFLRELYEPDRKSLRTCPEVDVDLWR